jgi:hypothetical protein
MISRFVKSVTPDFILDGIESLKKFFRALGKVLNFESPFRKESTTVKKMDEAEVAEVIEDVQSLGGFQFDLSENPMDTYFDDFIGHDVFKMPQWKVEEVTDNVCNRNSTRDENTKALIAKYNLPVAVAKKYAQRFEVFS